MTKKKLQNLLLAALLCASIVSFVSVENMEFYSESPVVTELQQSDVTMKFRLITQFAELMKEVVVPSFWR